VIHTTRVRKCWLARHRVDFRRHHDGLLAEAFKLGLDPFKGDLLIFIGRRKNRLKVLYADETGLWVSSKRFTEEAMKTRFRFLTDPNCTEITRAELAMIAEGAAYKLEKTVKPYLPDNDENA
jgi:transposase